jgi:hypothetical protein
MRLRRCQNLQQTKEQMTNKSHELITICLLCNSSAILIFTANIVFSMNDVKIPPLKSWAYGKGWSWTPKVLQGPRHALRPAGSHPWNNLTAFLSMAARSCFLLPWIPHVLRLWLKSSPGYDLKSVDFQTKFVGEKKIPWLGGQCWKNNISNW